MNALFAYGTLLFPEVLRVVAGRTLEARPAVLRRYRRRRVIGEIFPAIIEGDPGDEVAGVLYLGLGEREWQRLDRFEGALYDRRPVTPWCEGVEQPSFTYVLAGAARHRLDSGSWDPGAFAREHLAAFLERIGRGRDPVAVE